VTRTIAAIALASLAAGCASAPPAAAPAPPPGPTLAEKLASILRLEDARVLRDPAPPQPPPALPPPSARGGRAVVVAPPPPPPPDLLRFLGDGEARVRRRAALAAGRVGLREAVPTLMKALGDADPEVRQMAAFALGLIGDAAARESLIAALADSSPLVKGSAAEALGLIGDASAAEPIGQMAAALVQSGALAAVPGEDDDARRDTPSAALRLAIYALARLKAYPALAAAVLDAAGQPRVRWWPVAYALQRIEDPRALPALTTLAADPHPYVRAFAAKGLGQRDNRAAVRLLVGLAEGEARAVAVEAIRSLGRIGDPAAAAPLLKLVQGAGADPALRAEAVSAIGGARDSAAFEALVDYIGDRDPLVRAAVLRALVQLDPDGFLLILSALDPDSHWSVRAALASALGQLPAESALPRLRSMLGDADARVVPSVLASLARLRPPDAVDLFVERLASDDPMVRGAAAAALEELKPPAAAGPLADAYRRGQRDAEYGPRAAALGALAALGAAAATPVLTEALADHDWAVRVRAAALLKQIDPASDADARIRPAPPTPVSADLSQADRLANPDVSPHVYIETDRGTIEIELAVLEAPFAVESFLTLARKGFFNGTPFHRVVPNFVVQGGDPRGDGQGGPGYSIRDELSERPFLRGIVGMALDWRDTGGSQFFVTSSPQPHLDARYTVFGRVVSGMDVVDAIRQWDVIRQVRVNP
jgi:HEAT repeat protein